jgi:hypothetical protein
MGVGSADTTATATVAPPPSTANAAATPTTASSRLKAAVSRFVPGHDKDAAKTVAAAKPAEPKPAETKVAASRPPLKPSVADGTPADTASPQLSGAAPVVSANSFDSRFSAMK